MRVTEKIDIDLQLRPALCCFGAVLLELATGKRAANPLEIKRRWRKPGAMDALQSGDSRGVV